jgi:hypothetical protein
MRLEQGNLELRRIEERLEREDVQERLVQALQAQENYDNKIDVSRNMRSKSKK